MDKLSRRSMLTAAGAAAAATAVSAVPSVASAPTPVLGGKSFLITGCSSGFGRLGALHYARSGARVFATMRALPRPEADELRAIAAQERLDLHVLALDVRDEAQVNSAVAEAERINGGPLDVLVNNAGVVLNGPVEVHDMEAAEFQFDTNVFGFHRLARAVLPGMRARKSGLIFSVSSQQGRVIMPGSGLYAATKFAVEAWSEQLAYELAPHGIEVVIIQPGGYGTRVGENRIRYSRAVRERAEVRHSDGYPALVAAMGALPTRPPSAATSAAPDPMDVPRAIAEIAAMPPGSRPLRRPVHPVQRPQEAINRVSAETQRDMLSKGSFRDWAAAVLD